VAGRTEGLEVVVVERSAAVTHRNDVVCGCGCDVEPALLAFATQRLSIEDLPAFALPRRGTVEPAFIFGLGVGLVGALSMVGAGL
jgi:hypothetical protein